MHKVHTYIIKYHSVFHLVRIGTPLCPLPQASVSPPESKGETHSPAGEGAVVPIPTGEKAYSILSTLW
jgi:hypothetical protein